MAGLIPGHEAERAPAGAKAAFVHTVWRRLGSACRLADCGFCFWERDTNVRLSDVVLMQGPPPQVRRLFRDPFAPSSHRGPSALPRRRALSRRPSRLRQIDGCCGICAGRLLVQANVLGQLRKPVLPARPRRRYHRIARGRNRRRGLACGVRRPAAHGRLAGRGVFRGRRRAARGGKRSARNVHANLRRLFRSASRQGEALSAPLSAY